MKRKLRDPAPGNSRARTFLRIQDLTLALALVVACVGFFALRQKNAPTGSAALIYLGGEEIRRVELKKGDDYAIHLEGEYGVPVSFQVKEGGIRFVNVTCPDHICEKTGFVSADGQTAVCMPNKVAVHVVGG